MKVYALPIEVKNFFFNENVSEILNFLKNFVKKTDLSVKESSKPYSSLGIEPRLLAQQASMLPLH